MAQRIQITIDDKKVTAYFKQLQQHGQNPSPLLKQLGAIIADAIDENFEQQGRPSWQPLRASTLKQRTKKGYNGPILQRTGKLRRSITRKITATYVTVGTNLDYAAIHNFGGPTGKNHSVNMPRREFINLTTLDLEDIEKTAANYFDNIK